MRPGLKEAKKKRTITLTKHRNGRSTHPRKLKVVDGCSAQEVFMKVHIIFPAQFTVTQIFESYNRLFVQ